MGRKKDKNTDAIENVFNEMLQNKSLIPVPSDPIWDKISARLSYEGINLNTKALYARAKKLLASNDCEISYFTIPYEACKQIFNENDKLNIGWTDVMFEHVKDLFKSKCVWQFNRGKFRPTKSHAMSFEAYCKSCKSEFVAKSDEKVDLNGLSFDATGSICDKMAQNKQIFLYQVVVPKHENVLQLPVSQMLSSQHDALSIKQWLERWQFLGAKKATNSRMRCIKSSSKCDCWCIY